MDKVVIIGTTKFSRMVARLMEEENAAQIVAFSVSAQYLAEREIDGRPVIPFEELFKKLTGGGKILNTIGYTRMNTLRERLYCDSLRREYRNTDFISSRATVMCPSKATGSGNIILPGAVIGPDVVMEHGNIIYSGSVLTHDITLGNFNFVAAGTVIGGNVTVGDNCFIGMNCTVKNRVSLADMTLAGSGANIVADTESNSLYLGNPARKVPGKEALTINI